MKWSDVAHPKYSAEIRQRQIDRIQQAYFAILDFQQAELQVPASGRAWDVSEAIRNLLNLFEASDDLESPEADGRIAIYHEMGSNAALQEVVELVEIGIARSVAADMGLRTEEREEETSVSARPFFNEETDESEPRFLKIRILEIFGDDSLWTEFFREMQQRRVSLVERIRGKEIQL
jgi:hypothetical protein